jgi:hypothetical protein
VGLLRDYRLDVKEKYGRQQNSSKPDRLVRTRGLFRFPVLHVHDLPFASLLFFDGLIISTPLHLGSPMCDSTQQATFVYLDYC